MANVDWLLREATDERTLHVSERMTIDDASWRAIIERLEIGDGLRVFLTDAQAHQDIAVEARHDRTEEWIASQVTVAGSAGIDFSDGGKTLATPDQALLFRDSGRRGVYSLKAGKRFYSAGYGLDVQRVLRIFDGAVPSALRALLDDGDAGKTRILAMPGDRNMSNLGESLFAPGLNGALRRLMMEGAVIQLLAVQAAAAESRALPTSWRALSGRDRNAVHEARERLLADMRDPPTLGDLASAVGLSEKRLNAGFRAVFGTTVYKALRDERLEHARVVLETGEVPLKEIAFRVGYNHVSNFIKAFNARYGAPPGQYSRRTAGGANRTVAKISSSTH